MPLEAFSSSFLEKQHEARLQAAEAERRLLEEAVAAEANQVEAVSHETGAEGNLPASVMNGSDSVSNTPLEDGGGVEDIVGKGEDVIEDEETIQKPFNEDAVALVKHVSSY
jgi:hypothetical protein